MPSLFDACSCAEVTYGDHHVVVGMKADRCGAEELDPEPWPNPASTQSADAQWRPGRRLWPRRFFGRGYHLDDDSHVRTRHRRRRVGGRPVGAGRSDAGGAGSG